MIRGHFKPFESKFTNKIEIFSDLYILLISDSLLLFTDFLNNNEDKFNAAWITCITLSIYILGCIYLNLANLSWSLKLLYFKKLHKKINHYY